MNLLLRIHTLTLIFFSLTYMHRTLVNVPWCVCLYVREVHMYIFFNNNILLSSYTGSLVNQSVGSPFLTLFRVELTTTKKKSKYKQKKEVGFLQKKIRIIQNLEEFIARIHFFFRMTKRNPKITESPLKKGKNNIHCSVFMEGSWYLELKDAIYTIALLTQW